MAKDDLFRRSFEAGTAFLDMTRERAEALVKDFVKAGEVSKGKAQKLVDELLERSRKGTEELRELIRREMAEQVSALGLATKEDITRLEGRLDDLGVTGTAGAGPASTPTATRASPVRKSPAATKGEGTPPMAPAARAKGARKAPKARKGGAPHTETGTQNGEAGTATGAGGSIPTGGPPPNDPAPR